MSEGFWTGLQEDYDREIAKDQLGATLDDIHPIATRQPTIQTGKQHQRPVSRPAHAARPQRREWRDDRLAEGQMTRISEGRLGRHHTTHPRHGQLGVPVSRWYSLVFQMVVRRLLI